MSIFLYSTNYHYQQKKNIPLVKHEVRVGFTDKNITFRFTAFLKSLILCFLNKKYSIYLPRAGSLDIWLLYKIFKPRIILISDGLSDSLIEIPVFNKYKIKLSFDDKVNKDFNVKNIKHKKKDIHHSNEGKVALFTKRGRDYDYVSKHIEDNLFLIDYEINPKNGFFSEIYIPASTIAFELINSFPKEHIFVVSYRNYESYIKPERRKLLSVYEDYLSQCGFSVI